MRSYFQKDSLIAVSALAKETAINTEHALDTGMLCDLDSLPEIDARRESNIDEATGKEEADLLYDLGGVSALTMTFPKCQAQHMAFIGSYALGARSTADVGVAGKLHTILPIAGDLEAARSNPSFTLGARWGKQLEKRLFASMFIDEFTLSLARDSWAVLKANVKGTGKNSTNLCKETVNAAYNAASLTLLANGVAGATAQERIDNVHHIRVKVPTTNEWVDVVHTGVTAGPPSVITITPAGGVATLCDYEIIYNQAETGGYTWCSFPNRVEEDPIRVSDFLINIGGKWDGSALAGGHSMAADINSVDWTFRNKLTPDFTPGGGTYAYANRALREGREQTLSLDRQFRDYIFGQRFADIEYFTFYAIAEGEVMPGETTHKYTIKIIFPRVSVKERPRGRDRGRLVEKVVLDILEDDTYGSVILKVENQVATYAA
jgi:hypothetical protein